MFDHRVDYCALENLPTSDDVARREQVQQNMQDEPRKRRFTKKQLAEQNRASASGERSSPGHSGKGGLGHNSEMQTTGKGKGRDKGRGKGHAATGNGRGDEATQPNKATSSAKGGKSKSKSKAGNGKGSKDSGNGKKGKGKGKRKTNA